MKFARRGIRSLFLVAVALIGATSALAQTEPVDPPGRAARLAQLTGQVWIYSPGEPEWVGADLNRPLTSGDRIATDPGARAQLQVGSTLVRVDGNSELEVLELDDDRLSLQLHAGSIATRVRDLAGAGPVDVATEEGRFVIQRNGAYRFDRSDRASDATVSSGQLRYEGPNSGLALNAGEHARFWIDAAGAAQYSVLAVTADAFATWNAQLDRSTAAASAERYVSPEMTGSQELDRYGRWEQSPDYGPVWFPQDVAVDWAPYSQGRWAWVQPWGWTWVDAAPWGFAPFHYGRWVHVRDRWCWTPGARVVRPVYAPALVGWIGGPRAGVSVRIGGDTPVGWFPLGPREVYVPSYRASSRYVRNINVTHVRDVTVIDNVFSRPDAPREYRNRREPHAITVVTADVMAQRRPVAPAAAQFRREPWARELAERPGSAVAAAPAIMPSPRSASPGAPRVPSAAPAGGERPAFGRPGYAPRDRDAGERGSAQRGLPARGQAPGDRPAPPPPAVGTLPAPGIVPGPAGARPAPVVNGTGTLSPRGQRPESADRGFGPRPDAANRPERPDAANRFERPDAANRSERPDPANRSERPGGQDRADQPERPDRQNRPDRARAGVVSEPGFGRPVTPAVGGAAAPAVSAPPAPAVITPRPAAAAPAPGQTSGQAPNMRILPVRPDDERGTNPRALELRGSPQGGRPNSGAEAGSPGRPEGAQPSRAREIAPVRPVEVAPPRPVETAPPPRPVEAPRPARPAETQRPAAVAPAAVVEPRRAEPAARAEAPNRPEPAGRAAPAPRGEPGSRGEPDGRDAPRGGRER